MCLVGRSSLWLFYEVGVWLRTFECAISMTATVYNAGKVFPALQGGGQGLEFPHLLFE